MNYINPAIQIIIAIGLLNVWLLRSEKVTQYRGGSARSLKDEFKAYGLPDWFFQLIRVLKIGCALVLIIGLWRPEVVAPAAGLLCILMLGAMAMHFKVKDAIVKYVPALIMLILSAILVLRTI